jgi:phage portal protein BeeE
MRTLPRLLTTAALAALAAAPAAAEMITYTYDARGRLTGVARSGGPNAGATTTYQFDKADNRLAKTVAGASGAGSPPAEPGGFDGYRIIPTGPITPGSPPPGLVVVPAR